MHAPIGIRHLSKSFKPQQVLHDLNWEVEARSIVGPLGRNGAGKPTLMECLLGLRDADAGREVRFLAKT